MSKEYAAALEASRKASEEYNAAVRLYRAGKIGDGEYLAARHEYAAAEAAFDTAFSSAGC